MAERHEKTKPLSHLPKQALCVNWHHVNILTVAGLHRAHPSTSLDRQSQLKLNFKVSVNSNHRRNRIMEKNRCQCYFDKIFNGKILPLATAGI
jgi:hypothetical protein